MTNIGKAIEVNLNEPDVKVQFSEDQSSLLTNLTFCPSTCSRNPLHNIHEAGSTTR